MQTSQLLLEDVLRYSNRLIMQSEFKPRPKYSFANDKIMKLPLDHTKVLWIYVEIL